METPSSSPQRERPRPPASALAKGRDKERETGSAVLCSALQESQAQLMREVSQYRQEVRRAESPGIRSISANFCKIHARCRLHLDGLLVRLCGRLES